MWIYSRNPIKPEKNSSKSGEEILNPGNMASFAEGGQFQCRTCYKVFSTERGANYHARRYCDGYNADDSKVDNDENKDSFDDDSNNDELGDVDADVTSAFQAKAE